jgi:cytochrome b subunit of formate dehydrogenase
MWREYPDGVDVGGRAPGWEGAMNVSSVGRVTEITSRSDTSFEDAMLKAIGASTKQLLAGIVTQAVVVALIAFALAAGLVYLFTRRGRGLIFALLPSLSDVRQAWENVLYLVGLRHEPPEFDRFNYIEKAEYWALVWGTVVMTVTGLLLWFANQSLQWMPKSVLDLATLVHYYEAWLAFLAILIWHLYQNVLNPDVYPMNWAWVTGLISEEQLRHEHGSEWKRMEAEEASKAATAAKEGEEK